MLFWWLIRDTMPSTLLMKEPQLSKKKEISSIITNFRDENRAKLPHTLKITKVFRVVIISQSALSFLFHHHPCLLCATPAPPVSPVRGKLGKDGVFLCPSLQKPNSDWIWELPGFGNVLLLPTRFSHGAKTSPRPLSLEVLGEYCLIYLGLNLIEFSYL